MSPETLEMQLLVAGWESHRSARLHCCPPAEHMHASCAPCSVPNPT